MRTRLSNQGLPSGGEAYNNDISEFERNRGRSYNEAALNATLAADSESRSRRQQALGEFMTGQNVAGNTRATLVNELAQVLGQQQVQTPGLQNFFAPRGADFLGAQSLSSGVQAQNRARQDDLLGGIMGGLFGLGSAYIGRPPGP